MKVVKTKTRGRLPTIYIPSTPVLAIHIGWHGLGLGAPQTDGAMVVVVRTQWLDTTAVARHQFLQQQQVGI